MDQIKIGKFIAQCRKDQGMTQAVLAEQLGISDRAVSKWETGKSLPDSGIMLELCGLLKINVNELLSGEKIMEVNYNNHAEENMIALHKEIEEKNRMLLRMEYWVGGPATVVGLILCAVASYLQLPAWIRVLLIGCALVMIFAAAFGAVSI